ncbi:MAG: DUF3137 domain-containing protein [bacterium]|nr:DUF3137 domain-containing protein [bacterium]
MLVACPFVLGLLASRLNISEGTVDSLIFICIIFGGFTVWIYSSSRKNRIEKGFNAGLEAFKNVKEALSYSVDLEKLKPCVNSDIVEPNRSLSFDINGSCVDFLSLNFKVHTGKGSYMDNITETFHYKMKKTAKNSIICTFDSELTDCPLNPIETENPAFNKTYTVYCQNAEDAFYILTPHIMEEMLEVQAKCKRAI